MDEACGKIMQPASPTLEPSSPADQRPFPSVPARHVLPGRRGGFALRRRWLECAGVGLALFIQTGAVSILAYTDAHGDLTPSGARVLQALTLPGYLATLALLACYPARLLAAIRANPLVALLLVMAAISFLWSIAPSTTLRRGVALLLSVALAYLIAIRFTPRQFLVLVVLTTGLCMGLSLAYAAISPGWAQMPGGGALRGVFHHKNVLGWHAAIATVSAAALLADRPAGLRRAAIIVLGTGLGCLLLSGSATGLVAAASAGGFALFYRMLGQMRGPGRIVIILLAMQAAILVVALTEPLLGLVLEGTEKDASFTGRVPLWALVDEAILRRPLLGYGYGAFWTQGSGEAWTIWSRVQWPSPHAHNGFRDAMLSLGLGGTALLILVIACALRDGAVLHSRQPGQQWLWINILICVTLVMNLTETTLLAQNSFLFTIFMAAVLMISTRKVAA